MAVRRMFSREVCETDLFLDLPATAQRLYFFLGLQADDEGFLLNANSVVRLVGSSRDDLSLLCAKGFLIPFESGVVVLRHWRQHNYIPKDRFHSTKCFAEKAQLSLNAALMYDLDTPCIQCVDTPYPQGSLEEGSLISVAPAPAKKRFVPPTLDEVAAYCTERGNGIDAQQFLDHYEAAGWMRGKTKIKDWRACVRTWERNTPTISRRAGDPYAHFDRI
ncbi:MAG: hypothetical protein J6M47_09920 [Clostridia bacterium]|nr:hypothetical protein [Clostridia bacterium]